MTIATVALTNIKIQVPRTLLAEDGGNTAYATPEAADIPGSAQIISS